MAEVDHEEGYQGRIGADCGGGSWGSVEPLLRAGLELFDTFQRQIQACDGEIESSLLRLARKQRKPKRALPPPRYKFRNCDNEPRFDVRDPLFRLSGVDLTQIDGIGPTRRSSSSPRSEPT
jgi:hypothetical protein